MSSTDPYLPANPSGEPSNPPLWAPTQGSGVPAAPAPQWTSPTPPDGWNAAQTGAPQYAPQVGTYGAPAQPWSAAPAAAPSQGAPNPYGAPSYGAPSYGSSVPGGPVYNGPPVGAPMYAPTPLKAPGNGWAVAAFVVSLVMLVVGLFSGFYIGSLLVLLMARQGLRNAKTLEASGFGPRGRALAWWGMGIGILNVLIVLVLKFATI